jgi:hypothetical protein
LLFFFFLSPHYNAAATPLLKHCSNSKNPAIQKNPLSSPSTIPAHRILLLLPLLLLLLFLLLLLLLLLLPLLLLLFPPLLSSYPQPGSPPAQKSQQKKNKKIQTKIRREKIPEK